MISTTTKIWWKRTTHVTTRRWWRISQTRKIFKDLNSEQTISQNCSIICTNISWKQFMQFNIIILLLYLLHQHDKITKNYAIILSSKIYVKWISQQFKISVKVFRIISTMTAILFLLKKCLTAKSFYWYFKLLWYSFHVYFTSYGKLIKLILSSHYNVGGGNSRQQACNNNRSWTSSFDFIKMLRGIWSMKLIIL